MLVPIVASYVELYRINNPEAFQDKLLFLKEWIGFSISVYIAIYAELRFAHDTLSKMEYLIAIPVSLVLGFIVAWIVLHNLAKALNVPLWRANGK